MIKNNDEGRRSLKVIRCRFIRIENNQLSEKKRLYSNFYGISR